MEPTPRLSLIIPAYNEAALLHRLVDTVDRARAAYTHGPHAVEVIVADNGSTDGTSAIATARGCRVVSVGQRWSALVSVGQRAISSTRLDAGLTFCRRDDFERINGYVVRDYWYRDQR